MNVLLANEMTRLLQNDVTQEELVTYLETSPTELMLGIDNGSFISDYFFGQFSEYVFLCFILALCIWIVFLGADGEKAKAFVEMLPGTRTAKEMANFLPLLGILLINCFVGIVSTLVQLTLRNNEILDLEKRFPQLLAGRISSTLVADANIAFLQQALILSGFLVVTFLFYYLCGVLTKRRTVGIVFGVIFGFVWQQVVYYFMNLIGIGSEDGVLYMIPDGIASLAPENHACADVWNLPMILFLVAFCALLTECIIVHCKKMELSKGVLCYSRVVEVLMIGCTVEFVMMLLTKVFSLFFFYGDLATIDVIVRVFGSMAAFVGVVVTVLISYKLYHKGKKIKRVEVQNTAGFRRAWFWMDWKFYCIEVSGLWTAHLLTFKSFI